MRPPLFGRIAILGTGLIGGSLAAALSRNNVALQIAVNDTDEASSTFMLEQGYATSSYGTASEAVIDADIVVLAAPADELSSLLTHIRRHLKVGAIVTDVASIKRKVIASVEANMPETAFYVPGHPIAGSEKSGAKAASPALFEQKRVILTPSESTVLSEQVNSVRTMWESVGAHVEYMPADLHDRIYAYVSHLPQLLAYALKPSIPANAEGCEGALRLGASPASLWTQICFANSDFISEALTEYTTLLSQMHLELAENEPEKTQDINKAHTPRLLCAVAGLCLVATALLLEQRTNIRIASYGGTGFKSMTAAAGNHSDSVLSAISDNPSEVARLLQLTLAKINAISAALVTGNHASLMKEFS